MTWLAAACVVLAAVVVVWPRPGRRARRRRVLATPGPVAAAGPPAAGGPARPRSRASGPLLAGRHPGGPAWLLVVAAVAVATVLGGVVAGVVAGAYGALAARAALRRRAGAHRSAHRSELLDLLGAAAADLRAGLPAATALAGLPDPARSPHPSGDPLVRRVRAAVLLAEQTGAPLAEVIERVEADARAADRARSAAAAHAAGSRATAWLLAGLPAGGLALGYLIGADPVRVLLHTPIGAACAFGAVVLQLAGLAWARRITRPDPAVAS